MKINLQQEYMDACDQVHRLAQTLKERDAEIAAMAKLAVLLKVDIAEKDVEIERLKALCARAANALESGHEGRTGLPYEEKPGCQLCDLIAELRKAAQ